MRLLARSFKSMLIAVLLCAGTDAALALKCERVPDAPPAGSPQWGNLGVLKLRLIRYACSDAYDREVKRVLDRAAAYLQRRVAKVAKPAIVLDVDETALSNWPEIIANDIGFIPDGPCDVLPKGPCGWHAWIAAAKAEPLAPTLALYKAARERGVTVFFITGRRDDPQEREATERNLRAAGYDAWGAVMMRPPDDKDPSPQTFKANQRAKVEAQGYTIILNVGDQRSDLAGGHAERTFLVPNPFYFIR
jgi:HAD superfamily, subfamily IIIB (Acid phosphatase)